MKRIATLLTTVVVSVTPALVAAAPASAHTPYCGIRWGSQLETRAAQSTGSLVGVRAGRHACFDRLVLDVEGKADGYYAHYVDTVRQDGSGRPVQVRGGARLRVTVIAPPVPTDASWHEDGSLVRTDGYRTFRDVVWVGSFEGESTIGLGVRARLPFRVFLLDGPGTRSRVVVDVAHRW